jgi:steroid delta-isomerase-like uncharacterized protein
LAILFTFAVSAKENPMAREQSQKLVENFYNYFNALELDKIYTLVSDDVKHEMNNSGIEKGKAAFIEMMKKSTKHYREKVENVVYMVSDDGKNVATKFDFKGNYISTDESQIPAKNQPYQASAINYFEIENGKITYAACWFNEDDWKKQVSQ